MICVSRVQSKSNSYNESVVPVQGHVLNFSTLFEEVFDLRFRGVSRVVRDEDLVLLVHPFIRFCGPCFNLYTATGQSLLVLLAPS